ncbi:hypothetical protein ABZU75_45710 [Streptosporangium sp. NPDC005286]|uniref:hypothetical protein n=1 Tax=Streptosporangium sp. NPDC005286 TaxID=3154463 RepID=UPI0033AC08D5
MIVSRAVDLAWGIAGDLGAQVLKRCPVGGSGPEWSHGYWVAETRKLLTDHQVTVSATTIRFTTAAQPRSFLDNDDVPAQRPQISETLSHPALTAMSREELRQIIERLTSLQAARLERLRYQRRGGERLPGARGGIFQQKITDAERILAAILYQRKVCTRQVLSEPFEVSSRTIGNVLIETRPLLEHGGYNPAPAPTRHRTAAALLAVAAALLDVGQECHHPSVMKWSAASQTGDDEESFSLAFIQSPGWFFELFLYALPRPDELVVGSDSLISDRYRP